MNPFKAYKYLFYRTYIWQRGMFGDQNVPEFTAILANSLCIGFHLITLVICFQIITGYRLRVEKFHAVIGCLILIAINYFIFLYNDRLKAIISEFASETVGERKRRTWICWAYVLLSYLSFLGSVVILSPGPNK